MLGHPTKHLWWVHWCRRTLEKLGEAIPVIVAFSGPLLGILASRINPQAHGYRRSFHLRVFQGLSDPQGTCVH